MKNLLKIIFFLVVPAMATAQFNPFAMTNYSIDSLYSAFKQSDNDSIKMEISQILSNYYLIKDRDSCIYFSEQYLAAAKKLKKPLRQASALNVLSYALYRSGNYSKAFQAANDGLKLTEDQTNVKTVGAGEFFYVITDPHRARLGLMGSMYQKLAFLYMRTGNIAKGHSSLKQAINIAESADDKFGLSLYHNNLGDLYMEMDKLDSALIFEKKALDYAKESPIKTWIGVILLDIGRIYLQQETYDSARIYIQQSLVAGREQLNLAVEGEAYYSLAKVFLKNNQPDSALVYSNRALKVYEQLKEGRSKSDILASISDAYQKKSDTGSAFMYLRLSKDLADSMFLANSAQTNLYQNLIFDEQLRLMELEEEKASFQTKIRTNTLLGSTFTLLIIAFFLYRNSRQKQKANILLKEQKEEIESTLEKLESTQSQLIQSEKMASLGELTAGIAHEIQNPLNFVNNFSEVNDELIEELREAVANNDQKEIQAILNDLKENESKIKHHGQRAEGIVKGMLQHSRTSHGEKEPTDLNALADEYLRLAYHGLRAKDKSFNADYKTELDKSLPKVNVIPQDIGRVLLNLINNAFYASNSKSIATEDSSFKPMVEVATKMTGDKIQITVKDNGPGIPEEIKEKIFQPFFTTKPTGSGTGLGLSLSYDIVKAHAGDIKVESPPAGEAGKEGAGTEFIIKLPKT